MATVELIVDLKDPQWLIDEADHVLALNEIIFVSDGRVGFGDGITEIQNLTFFTFGGSITWGGIGGNLQNQADLWAVLVSLQNQIDAFQIALDAKADKQSELLTPTTNPVEIGTFGSDNVRVVATTFFIAGSGLHSAPQTDFNVALSTSGFSRYVVICGTTSNTVIKVEGAEAGEFAIEPDAPAGSFKIRSILVTDAGLGVGPDLSGYLLKADKATSADIVAGTSNDKYITPAALFNTSTKLLFKTNARIEHTGTTDETVLYTALIPAGTITGSGVMHIYCRPSTGGGTAAKTFRVKIGATPNVVDAGNWALYQFSTLSGMFKRRINIDTPTSQRAFTHPAVSHLNCDTANVGDVVAGNTINFNADVYLFFTATLANASDGFVIGELFGDLRR